MARLNIVGRLGRRSRLAAFGLVVAALALLALEGSLALFGVSPLPDAPFILFTLNPEEKMTRQGTNYRGEPEVVFVSDSALLWKFRPSSQVDLDPGTGVEEFRRHYPINAHGFRGRPFSTEKSPGTYRILALGDSMTFGLFVEEDSIYTRVLERTLNRLPLGQEYEVITLGVPGYTSFQGLQLLRREVFAYQPDLLLYYFGSNNESTPARLTDQEHSDLFRNSSLRSQLRRSRVFSTMERVASWIRLSWLGLEATVPHVPRTNPTRRVPIHEFVQHLGDFYQLARARGVEAIMIVPPHAGWPIVGNPGAQEYTDATRFMARYVPAVDVDAAFRSATDRQDDPFAADNMHPNARGHAVIAGAIARKLYPFLDARGLWHFDEVGSSFVVDEVTGRRDPAPGSRSARGVVRGGRHFPGGATIRTGLNLKGAKSLTVAFWVRPEGPLTGRHGIIFENDHTQDSNCVVQSDDSTNRRFAWVCRSVGIGFALPVERWSHVAATAGGETSEMRLFINGKPVGRAQLPGPLALREASVNVGGWARAEDRYFRGTLDELVVWNRVIDADEVQNVMCGGVRYTLRKDSSLIDEVKAICTPAAE